MKEGEETKEEKELKEQVEEQVEEQMEEDVEEKGLWSTCTWAMCWLSVCSTRETQRLYTGSQ